jgi:multiple antibiotic resistance protein
MKNFFLAFIPIFVAVDALGILPIYCSLTARFKKKAKLTVIIHSMITAIILATGFIFLGKALFGFLGITIGDFMIAGGAVLFSIAILDIVGTQKSRHTLNTELAAVPLGTPLIVGPAVLTTSLILIGQYGTWLTLFSVIINVLITGIFFFLADFIVKYVGERTLRVLSKVTHLLLAAIAIMLIRKGIFLMIALF